MSDKYYRGLRNALYDTKYKFQFASISLKINENKNDINGIKSDISDITNFSDLGRINTNASNISNNLEKINTNTSNISINLEKINTNDNDIDEIKSNLTILKMICLILK